METSVDGNLVLIFSSTYTDTVNDFLNHFEAHLRAKFRNSTSLFNSSTPFSTGAPSISSSKTEYGRQLAALYSNNPQEAASTTSPPKPKKLYYGAADSAPDTYLNHLMQPSPSKKASPLKNPPIAPVSPSSKKSPPTTDPTLMDRLSKLEKSTSKLSESIDTRFADLEKKQAADKAALITAVTTTVTTVMSNSLPQLIADQLKVAITSRDGETQ